MTGRTVPLTDLTPAARHAVVADGFTRRVLGVPSDGWDAPAPVEGWVARDVVRHLVTWFPGFLAGGTGTVLPSGPPVEEDPVGAWVSQRDAVQAVLDDPSSADEVLSNPHTGEVPLPEAVDRFYTADVFMHAWDLARASGQQAPTDERYAETLLEGMRPIEDLLRSSGQYGAPVPVPEDASAVDRLMGFVGRDPAWRPPS